MGGGEDMAFFLGLIYLGRVVVPSPQIVTNFYKSFTVKENHIIS